MSFSVLWLCRLLLFGRFGWVGTFERHSDTPVSFCQVVADRFRWGRLRPSWRGSFVLFVPFGCIFPASLYPLLISLSDWIHFSPPVFRSSSCRYSDVPLILVLCSADNVVIRGILHLVFKSPSSWLSIIGLFSQCCCCFGTLMVLVLCFVDSLVIGVDNTLHLQAPFPGFLRYILF